jgi:hypothetical protein
MVNNKLILIWTTSLFITVPLGQITFGQLAISKLDLCPFGLFASWQGPGVNVIKLFFFIADEEANKLECVYLAIPFQSSQTFAGSTRSLPKKEASERHSDRVGPGLALKF